MNSSAIKGKLSVIIVPLLFLLAACGSTGGRPAPKPSEPYAEHYYEVAMVQCLINKGLVPSRDVQGQSWFKDGKVLPKAEFGTWVQTYSSNKYGDKTLDDWLNQAQKDWPSSYCGPSPAPS